MCMRKFQSFAFAGAIALAGVAGFSACSSDDAAEAPINPTFDGESVKAAFAINVAAPSKGGTRMDGGNTQQGVSWSYLSMDNIYLMALNKGNESTFPADGSAIDLMTKLSNPSSVTTSKSSHIYKNISIPVGTTDFLFYATRGTAAKTTDNATTKFQKGIINSSLYADNAVIGTTNDINFSLVKILSSTDQLNFSTVGDAFASYVNAVKNVSGWSSTDDAVLASLYTAFTKENSHIACSANGVRRMMSDLYTSVKARQTALSDGDAKTLAGQILSAILNKSTTGAVIKFSALTTADDTYTLTYETNVDEKYKKFPSTFNLPDGAAQLSIASTGDFSFVTSATVGPDGNLVNVNGLTYPACVSYYVNTPAKASDKEIQTSEWQATTTNWDNWSEWNSWTDAVAPTTRSIALKNNINYGVACLATTVKCANVTLKDNAKTVVGGTTEDNDVNIGTGFQVTGILIGGQPGQVGWQYVNTSSSNEDRKAVIYDNSLASITATTAGSSTNYTLLFDNYKGGGTQENVNVAIELLNNKQDFYGVNGIIPKGQKFYLVGQLTLGATGNISSSAAVPTPKWPVYGGTGEGKLPASYENRYPAMAGRAGQAINRVFVQDYTTTANFTIKDLKKAYVTIPDLRASQLQLGLSVDLTWKTGLTFDVNL